MRTTSIANAATFFSTDASFRRGVVYNSHMGEDVKMTGEERANPQLLEKG